MYYNHWLPKLLKVNAIVLLGVVYFAERKKQITERLYKHELRHKEQQEEDGVKFYIIYLKEYFVNLVKYRNHHKAYYNISYEKDARKADGL